MRVLIRLESRIEDQVVPEASVPRFELLSQRGGRFRAAITASLAVHLAAAVVAPPLIEYLSRSFEPVVDFRRAEMLSKKAVPLYIRFPEKEPALKPKLDPAKKPPEPQELARNSKRARPKQPAAPTERPVERPATAILIQPDLGNPRLREVPDLRSVKVWTGLTPRPGSAPIAPGNVEPVPSSLVTAIRIRPNIPLPEPVQSDIPAPRLNLPPVPARLAYVPSGSPPVNSLILQLEEPPAPPGSSTPGDPAAIIASSSLPSAAENLKVPPGSIVVIGSESGTARGQVPRPQQTTLPGAVGAQNAPATTNSSPDLEARNDGRNKDGSRSGGATDGRAGRAEGSASAAGGNGPGGNGQGTSGESIRRIRTAGGEITAREKIDGSVRLSYPKDGNFDVVVLESALPERLTQFNHVLSGKPVHTVYLNVGLQAEWVLQYCLPAGAAEPAQQGMVVNLDAPPPLKAPYVIEAILPAGVLWRSADFQVFHAMMNVAGGLEQLRIIKAGSAGAAMLEALKSWTFRPATSGGVPKLVEVLLVIPPFVRN